MALTIESRITLSDGAKIPVLGLGVWQAGAGKETRKAVSAALESGYRLIDTAKLYGNERDVGAAVRESGIPRDEIFVTTKLWNSDQGFESALRAFDGSRRELGLEYVDLYLVHWPVPQLRNESWKALLKIREQGLARSIGVSNYTIPLGMEPRRSPVSSIHSLVTEGGFYPRARFPSVVRPTYELPGNLRPASLAERRRFYAEKMDYRAAATWMARPTGGRVYALILGRHSGIYPP